MSKRRFAIIKVSIAAFALIFSACATIFDLSHTAFASPSNADIILKKTLLNGIQTCYNDTYMKSSIIPADFVSPGSLFTSGFGTKGDSDGTIRVPNNVGNTLNDADISCQQLFNGYSGVGGKISGLFSLFGKSSSVSSEAQKISLLKNLGYYVNQTESSVDTGCLSVSYQTVQDSQYTNPISTNQICIKLTDGKIDVGYSAEGLTYTNDFTDPMYIYYDPVNYKLSLMSTESLYELNYVSLSPYRTPTWSEFETTVKNQFIGDYNWDGEYGQGGYHYRVQSVSANTTGGETFSEAVRSSNAAQDALHFFSGEPNATFTTYSFVTEDKYALYTAYLNQELQNNSNVIMGSGSECASTLDAAKSATGYAVRNGAQWCALHGVESGGSYNIIENRLNNKLIAGTFKDVVNELMSLNYDRLEEAGVDIGELEGGTINGGADTNNPDGNPGGGEVSSITACFDSAGVLGWIACPVLEVMSGITKTLYGFVEDSLSIDSDLMGAEGIKSGWGIFRDFANIIFAIAFVIVILSQVTGIGITNYGIKKVLPRLIMVVILVNISFILCQLAVDVSNILGSSLKATFDGFSETVAQGAGGVPFNLGTVVGGLAGTAVAVGGVVAVTAVLAITIPFELWLFPIMLAILGCLISVFFFFVLLGVRQAGVVVLVTLAPVAIVCYAFPNTKTFFDRWKKLFTALLLVYPICGLLMGGGTFASTLLLSVAHDSDSSGFFVIVAMLMNVVPFFMIPSILKSSMAAMGNLGMKISNFGSRIGGGITRGIRNSEVGRDIQRRANMNYADRAASKIERSQKGLAGKIKPLRERNQKRLGRFNTMYNRYSYEDIRAGGAATRIKPGTAMYEALEQGQKSKQFEEDVAGRQELLKNGAMSSKLPGGGTVSGNDEDGMIAELDGYLERIIDGVNGGKTEAELEDDVKNAQAIMDTLSATGKGSTMGRVENSFARAMHNKQGILTSATGDVKTTLAKTFGSLGARTMRKFGKDYKKNSPGAAALFGDISKGEFSRAGTFRLVDELENDGSFKVDHSGSRVQHFASSYYSGSGLSGINPEDLSKMKPHHLSNILDGIEHGDIKGSNALDIAHAADEMLSHPEQFAADADSKAYIERIRNAALSSGHLPTGGTRTTGAMAIGRADLNAINGILNSIQGAKSWGHLSADEQARYGQLVSNIHDSLSTDMHTSEGVQQLKQALSIAKSKGFIDSSTHAVVDEFTGTPTLKITRGAKQKVTMPAGWARGADGKWYDGGMGSGRPLNATEVVKAEQIERHNNQIDIDNGTV